MLVRTWMSKNVVTVSPDKTMKDATDIMREHEFRHLPVVEGDRLVGMVTLTDIRCSSPSLATTFSVGEINYLVDQIRVSDMMTREVVTVSPDTTVEDAALMGHKRGISALPVVEDGRLVGIITQTDLYDILMSIFQAGEDDARITLENMPPKLGSIQKIIDVLDRHSTRFSSILTFPQRDNGTYTYWVRVARGKVDDVVQDLEAEGMKVSHYS
jgi:acetoin utilization protein AcuB